VTLAKTLVRVVQPTVIAVLVVAAARPVQQTDLSGHWAYVIEPEVIDSHGTFELRRAARGYTGSFVRDAHPGVDTVALRSLRMSGRTVTMTFGTGDATHAISASVGEGGRTLRGTVRFGVGEGRSDALQFLACRQASADAEPCRPGE